MSSARQIQRLLVANRCGSLLRLPTSIIIANEPEGKLLFAFSKLHERHVQSLRHSPYTRRMIAPIVILGIPSIPCKLALTGTWTSNFSLD